MDLHYSMGLTSFPTIANPGLHPLSSSLERSRFFPHSVNQVVVRLGELDERLQRWLNAWRRMYRVKKDISRETNAISTLYHRDEVYQAVGRELSGRLRVNADDWLTLWLHKTILGKLESHGALKKNAGSCPGVDVSLKGQPWNENVNHKL